MKLSIIFCILTACASAQTILLPEDMLERMGGLAKDHPQLKLSGYRDSADALTQAASADAYIGSPEPALMEVGVKLRWIHIFSAGIENYTNLLRIKDGQVTLTSLKIYQGPEIADHAFALLLSLTRNMASYQQAQLTGQWLKSAAPSLPLIELRGKTMLVVGYGGIGVQVAERAKAFGMLVHAIDPNDIPLTQNLDDRGKPDELGRFLETADVVVSCVPLTPQTDGMFGEKEFSKIKQGAYFINVSRGKVVDTAAMLSALESGRLAGAGLDVVDPEPLPAEHPLWKMKNVIITPHIAGISEARTVRQNNLIEANIARFATGLPLKNQVDAAKGY